MSEKEETRPEYFRVLTENAGLKQRIRQLTEQRDLATDNFAAVEAENERLRAAVKEAHRQLSRFDHKGPKQVGRAMMTLEAAVPSLSSSPEPKGNR